MPTPHCSQPVPSGNAWWELQAASRCAYRIGNRRAGAARAGLPGEFGADLIGVGVAQVVEDVQGLLPGSPGVLLVTGRITGVAEVGEDLGFVEAVPEFPEKEETALVAVGGVAMVTELVLDVAEAVRGVCLLDAMQANFLIQSEGLLAERAGPLRRG